MDAVDRPDVAILIALPEEFQTLADEYSRLWTPRPNPVFHGSDFIFEGPKRYRCVATIMPRMGPTVAVAVSQRLLAWRPAVIVNVGIAGSIVKDLCIGDVIVPREVDAYDETGKQKDTGWQFRGSDYRPSANLIADVRELPFVDASAHRDWARAGANMITTLLTGPDAEDVDVLRISKLLRETPIVSNNHLASGSFVVTSKAFAEVIRTRNADVHAVEMEAAGMLAAVEYWREPVQSLVVRGISDHVDADKAMVDRIGEGALRRLAMANAWRLVCTLMMLDRLPRVSTGTQTVARAPEYAQMKVAPTRLPAPAHTLFGREKDLATLTRCWANSRTNVVTIIAWGGVGKTALIHEWRNRLLRSANPPEWVFDWSFYSQGVRERVAVSADNFLREALIFFGDPEYAISPASPLDKGTRLAEIVGARRALLILDGLEPLQHPPIGGESGELREGSIANLLRGLADKSQSLCVVTSRETVRELDGRASVLCLPLGHLSEAAGADLLKSLLESSGGPKPVSSTQAERREISRKVEGHALTLQLLGSFIRRALGDVRRWTEIDFERANEEQGGHAFRVIEAYTRWLSRDERGQRQLAALKLLGLFDRPADPGELAALMQKPPILGLTEPLIYLDDQGWRMLVSSLEELHLATRGVYEPVQVCGYDEVTAKMAGREGALGEPKPWRSREFGFDALVIDAHPLVRAFFARALRQDAVAWREGHLRLYEHLCESVPYWPEGAEGLQPLYQSVAHGCAAEEFEACWRVFRDRIMRGGARFYSTRHCGAFGADLAAIACFFDHLWDRPSPKLSSSGRSWVLNAAGFRLRGLGRLSDSLVPMRMALQLRVEQEDWRLASSSAGNLSRIELSLGRTSAAVNDAAAAVNYADRSNNGFRCMVTRNNLADAQHQAGDHVAARELFEQAETMQAVHGLSTPQFSYWGFRYADLLLSPAERAAWRSVLGNTTDAADLVAECAAVVARATRTLAIARQHRVLLHIALDHLTLGRAALFAAILHTTTMSAIPELSFAAAQEHIGVALDGLRRVGDLQFVPRGLIARACLTHATDPDSARADLDEAWKLAERGPMPLFQADIHLTHARLFHDPKALANARTLITRYEYNRRIPELEDAELAANSWSSPKRKH